MKKEKNKGLDKKIKKALGKEIEARINEQILRMVSEMGYESKRMTKAIQKDAKKMAKRLTTVINDNQRQVKGVPEFEKEQPAERETVTGNFPEFSSPQPISLPESGAENSGNKKPVVPSDSVSSPSALDMAEKITES